MNRVYELFSSYFSSLGSSRTKTKTRKDKNKQKASKKLGRSTISNPFRLGVTFHTMLCLGRFVAVGSCSSSYRLAGSCLLPNTRHAAKARSLPTKQASVRLLSVTAVDHASQTDNAHEAVVSTLADGEADKHHFSASSNLTSK